MDLIYICVIVSLWSGTDGMKSRFCGPLHCQTPCNYGYTFNTRGCRVCECHDPCKHYVCANQNENCVPDARGRPQCQVLGTHFVRSTHTGFIPRPVFRTQPTDRKVMEGHTFFWECDTKNPPEQIRWLYKGRQLPVTPHITVLAGGMILSFVEVRAHHAGTYTCVAQAGFRRARAQAKLIVTPSVSPTIDKRISSYNVTPGDNLVLNCDAAGVPPPRIQWLRGQQVVSTGPYHNKLCNGTLVFRDVRKRDEGTYVCVADNLGGTDRWNASVNVRGTLRGKFLVSNSMLISMSNSSIRNVSSAVAATLLDQNNPRKNRTPEQLLRFFRSPSCRVQTVATAADSLFVTLETIRDDVLRTNAPGVPVTAQDMMNSDQLSLLSNMTNCAAVLHNMTSELCNDTCYHFKYRTFDGTCNNFRNPQYGAAVTPLQRILPAEYDNEYNYPKGWDPNKKYNGFKLPSARDLSLKIVSTSKITDDVELSHMVMQWGQFLDHDLDLTPTSVSNRGYTTGSLCNETCTFDSPCFPIPVSRDDPRVKKRKCMSFTRSSSACPDNNRMNRDQINSLTAYIDGSQVYGSSDDVAQNLRKLHPNKGLLREGVLLASGKPLLPFPSNGEAVDCLLGNSSHQVPCFIAGDMRLNEQLGLIAIHTLWFREHNRIAKKLEQLNPTWNGDVIYHEARKIVGAELQHITFNEWLPLILGPVWMENRLGPYNGYDVNADASISNAFSTAAFRFGHAIIHPIISRFDCQFQPIPEGHLSLREAFFSPHRIVTEGGIDPVLRGFYGQDSKLKLPDELLSTELTEHLFEMALAVALDLGSLNIQRGRDHGLPGYNMFRRECGLRKVRTFKDFKDEINADVLKKLEEMYGHPDNVDLWLGGLLENVLPGAKVGPTFACIIGDQMKRSRDGDRFWYENPGVFTPAQLTELKQANLARIICDNSDGIEHVQLEPFRAATFPSGMLRCDSPEIPHVDLRMWTQGCQEQPSSVPPYTHKYGEDSGCNLRK